MHMRGSRNSFQGGPGPTENSFDNVFLFVFLVHLILQFTEGVQWFITEKTILFQGSREGPTFSGGGGGPTFFQRGPNANFYRNPYNFRVPTVREKSGKNEKKKKIKVREKSGNFYFSQGNLKFWQKSGNFRIRSREWRNQAIRR